MRHLVVTALFVLSLITYIDRAAISSVKDALQADLELDNQSIGGVFSAFALGYALAQIPAGWLADRWGPRRMLTLVVAVWSLLTAATGAASTLTSLLAIRFLFGAAEAGAFPGCARAFYNWLPAGERGRANGVIFAGSRLGAAGAFSLMAWILASWDWRWAFYWIAAPGLVWAGLWLLWFRDHPPKPVAVETAKGHAARLGAIFASRRMVLAMGQYFAVNFTTFLCLSWMLPYLKQRYSLSTADAAYYAGIPLLIGAAGQWITGWCVDWLYRGAHRAWSRRLPAMAGFAVSACGISLIPFAPDAMWATAAFTVAAFGAEMTISPSWAFAMDIGGRLSGSVSGAMNMMGNLGSFVSANLFPLLQSSTGDASAYFYTVAALNLASIVAWAGMRSEAE
jgi:ACS family glucarate transporter-like MFS transporter